MQLLNISAGILYDTLLFVSVQVGSKNCLASPVLFVTRGQLASRSFASCLR